MKYLIVLLLFASCAGNYTLVTDYGAFRNLRTEELVAITHEFDSLPDTISRSFILFQRKFIGRDYLMHMIDTIPEFYYAEDCEGNPYIGKDYWFIRKYINK